MVGRAGSRSGCRAGLWRPPRVGVGSLVAESAAQRDGPKPLECGVELAAPWPTVGQVQLTASSAAGEPSGQGDQFAAEGLGDDGSVVAAEEVNPAEQVVSDGGEHGPGPVGVETA